MKYLIHSIGHLEKYGTWTKERLRQIKASTVSPQGYSINKNMGGGGGGGGGTLTISGPPHDFFHVNPHFFHLDPLPP